MRRLCQANTDSTRHSVMIQTIREGRRLLYVELRLGRTSMASLQVTSGVMVIGVLSSRSAILFLVHQALIEARGVVWRRLYEG